MLNLLTNPLVMRSALLFVVCVAAFVLALMVIRALRRTLVEDADFDSTAAPKQELPLHLYSTVIQQLKQQKHELQIQNQTEQRRARTSENFSQTVLSNLPCGVLVFGSNGLIKQANPAAKEILGFKSPSGMNAHDIFRDTTSDLPARATESDRSQSVLISEEVEAVLLDGGKRRQVNAIYSTPAGTRLDLSLTVSPIPSADGSLLGVACLIANRTDVEQIRRQREMDTELSAEMALQFRTSLNSIADYAQQLATSREPQAARQLAEDIASEAANLDRRIGGFLAKKGSEPEEIARGAAGAR